jgi:CheY-like chemotaxis protein
LRRASALARVNDRPQALEQSRHEMSFQLVISDVRLPGRDGLSLFEECRERWPQLAAHFFFITGDGGSRELNTSLEQTGCLVLR